MINYRRTQFPKIHLRLFYYVICIALLGCKKASSLPTANPPAKTGAYSKIINELKATITEIQKSPPSNQSAIPRIESTISSLEKNQPLPEGKPFLFGAALIHDDHPITIDEADRIYILGLAQSGEIDRVEATDTEHKIILTEHEPKRLLGAASVDGKLSIFAVAFYVSPAHLTGNLLDADSVRIFFHDGSQTDDLKILKSNQ